MKRLCFSVSLLAVAVSVSANTKLDANSQMIADSYLTIVRNPGKVSAIPADAPFSLIPNSRGQVDAGAYVILAPGTTVADLADSGMEVIAVAGNVALVRGTMNDMLELADTELITHMSFGEKCQPCLSNARTATNVTSVHNGTDLNQTYKGKGVICGIFDTGVDPNHINFMTTDLSTTRIKALYHFNGNSGGSIAYTSPERIASFTTDSKSQTHGTHTLGCMAGSFNRVAKPADGLTGSYAYLTSETANTATLTGSRKNPYYGIAPEADLVVGCGSLYEANISGAVAKIVNYAKDAGQPAVVNLSIGSLIGPRDGSDARGQFLSNCAKDAIIFVSAGNNGDSGSTMSKTFTSSDNVLRTFFGINNGATGTMDIWSADSRNFKVKFVIFNMSTNTIAYEYELPQTAESTTVLATKEYTQSGYIHNDAFDNAFSASYIQAATSQNTATNNRFNCTVSYSLFYNTTTNASGNLISGIIIEGVAGQRIDLANNSQNGFLSGRNVEGWSNPTSDMSINNIATAKGVFAVGAYATLPRWGTMSRSVYGYNDGAGISKNHICSFSSYGVLADGRSLPQICAPGAPVISSYSKYYYDAAGLSSSDISALYNYNNRAHYWAAEQGTSMASPIAAGIVALWLQADPTLKYEDVLKVFEATAKRPEESMSDNNTAWGYGGIDAYEGIKYVLNAGVNDIKIDAAKPLITSRGTNVYEVFVPDAKGLNVTVYNMSGQAVKTVTEQGNTATVDLSSLTKGVYLISATNHNFTERIMVR